MPNWCANNLTLGHDDPAMIERVARAFEAGKLLQEFIPMPKELLEGDGWYGWAVSNWGTKWDVSGDIMNQDPNEIDLMFDSAWSPPVAAYEYFREMGFRVRGSYHEPGMGFAGVWEDGNDDYLDYSNLTPEEIRTNYKDLDDEFGIADMLEELQEQEDEE